MTRVPWTPGVRRFFSTTAGEGGATMRRVSVKTLICTGCDQLIPVVDGDHPVELELVTHGEPRVRVIAIGGTEVHRCSRRA